MKTKHLLISLLLLSACGKNTVYKFDNVKTFDDSQFKEAPASLLSSAKVVQLNGKDIDAISVVDSGTIAVIDIDKSLAFYNKNFKKVQEVNYTNTPRFEPVSPINIFKTGYNKIGVFDLTKNEIFELGFSKSEGVWKFLKRQQFEMGMSGFTNIFQLSDSSFIANSINIGSGQLINFKVSPTPEVKKLIGEKIEIQGINPFVTGLAYRNSFSYDYDNAHSYLAFYYTDVIESYDAAGKLQFRIQGPMKFNPKYKVAGSLGKERFMKDKDAKTAYLAIDHDKKFIYALFSGNKVPAVEPVAQKVYIFDKNGKPYMKITLPKGLEFEYMTIDKYQNALLLVSYSEDKGAVVHILPTSYL